MTPRIPSATAPADVIPSHTFSNASLLEPPETGGPNGGYLAKLLWEASVDRVELRELAPRVATVQFISSPAYEPMRIDVEVPRKSLNSCFLSVTAYQAGHVRLAGQLFLGRSEPGPCHQPDEIPAAPAPELCPSAYLPRGRLPHFRQHCDYRIVRAPAVFSGAGRAEMLCWIRMRDLPLDAGGMLFLLDAMFPPFFLAATLPHPTVTTHLQVEYSDSFLEEKPGAWVLVSLRVRQWAGGWCIEDADAWSAGGWLLAVARQMRRVFA